MTFCISTKASPSNDAPIVGVYYNAEINTQIEVLPRAQGLKIKGLSRSPRWITFRAVASGKFVDSMGSELLRVSDRKLVFIDKINENKLSITDPQ